MLVLMEEIFIQQLLAVKFPYLFLYLIILYMTTTFNWTTTSNPLQIFSGTQNNFLQYILGNWTSISCDSSGQNLIIINSYLPLNNIFISNNYGNQWNNLTTSLGNINLSQAVITPNANCICLAAIRKGIYISNNSGGSWGSWEEYLSENGIQNSIACSSNGQIILTIGCLDYQNYYLLMSTNNGINFINPPTPSIDWNYVSMNSLGTIMAACSSDGQCYISNDTGTTWTPSYLPKYNWNSISMDSTGNNIVICSLNGFIYISNNSGSSWTLCSPINLTWNSVFISSNANIIFATALNSSDIYYSTSNGTNWLTTSPNPNSTNWGAICCNNDGSIVYTCINGGFIYIGSSQ